MIGKELSPEEIKRIEQMTDLIKEERYYELLGVGPDADYADIRTAFKSLTRKWHPDIFFRRDLGEYDRHIEHIFMMITKAHRILTNPEDRKEYDRTHVIDRVEVKDADKSRQTRRHRHGKRRRERERRRTSSNEEKQSPKEKVSLRKQKILDEVRKNIDSKSNKAKQFFEIGKRQLEEERPMQAAASLQVAYKLEPKNKEYKELYAKARKMARSAKAFEIFASAENAENYSNYTDALKLYRKAVEYEVDDARAYARLAYLIQKLDPDARETIRLMQIAVKKSPDNPEYHCILGEIFAAEGLGLNARREFNKALELQKNYDRAKEGLKNI